MWSRGSLCQEYAYSIEAAAATAEFGHQGNSQQKSSIAAKRLSDCYGDQRNWSTLSMGL
jgi:hypothetical protein